MEKYTSERTLKEYIDNIDQWTLEYRADQADPLTRANRERADKEELDIAIGDLLADIEQTARDRHEFDVDADAPMDEYLEKFAMYLWGLAETIRMSEVDDERFLFHILDIEAHNMLYSTTHGGQEPTFYGQTRLDLIAYLFQ